MSQKQKPEKKERRAKVGNNNGQLRIANVTSVLGQKVSENNGQLPYRTTPYVEHVSRLDQKSVLTMAR